jgi:hypothetical protein
MVSLLPGNEISAAPLKKWPPPNSSPRPVGGASGSPGTPNDTWESVAKQYGVDVGKLIFFNFETNNPHAVNSYLRIYVGCNTPSATRWNWTFKSAKPGIIYLPNKTIVFDDAHDAGPGQRDGRPHKIPDFHFKDPQDISNLVDAVEHIPEVGNIFQYTKWLLYVTVGSPNEEAIVHNRESEYKSGVSLGMVLGADNRSKDFIVGRNFQTHYSYRDSSDRNMDALYQLAYLNGLKDGLDYSRHMNDQQKDRFRNVLRSQMTGVYPSYDNKEAWKQGTQLRDYYIDAGAAFNRSLLTNWVSGTLQSTLESKSP